MFLKESGTVKHEFYQEAGVEQTPFHEGFYVDNKGRRTLKAGFFSPYKSVHDFGRQLKAPFVMPVICVVAAIQMAAEAVKLILFAAVDLASVNIKNARKNAFESLSHFAMALYFMVSAVFDACWAFLSLTSRCCTSVVAALGECSNDKNNSPKPS